jgi:hypothetical protein
MGQRGTTLARTPRSSVARSFDRAGDAVVSIQNATDRVFRALVAYFSEMAVRIDPSDRAEANRLRASSDAYSLTFTPLSPARRAIIDRGLREPTDRR